MNLNHETIKKIFKCKKREEIFSIDRSRNIVKNNKIEK